MNSFTLRSFITLIKLKVSLAVTFTAITGYIVYFHAADLRLFELALGVFILASGSGALNEFQERKFDAKMPRTWNRPLPSGIILPVNVLRIAFLMILVGTYLLKITCGDTTALLGVFNVFWYNGFYTYLKRITPYAVVPGSLVGAIPVFMGWSAAGGNLWDVSIIFIAFFLFIWQVPHFWLLMQKYGEEYKVAGFPTINESIRPKKLKSIIFFWILATSLSSLMIPFFLPQLSNIFLMLIFVLNLLFITIFAKISFGETSDLNLRKLFISINVYMLLFMLILIIYHLV